MTTGGCPSSAGVRGPGSFFLHEETVELWLIFWDWRLPVGCRAGPGTFHFTRLVPS